MDLLDIGVLSKGSGVPASTLRYYEELDPIRSAARHGLRRQFDEGTLIKLGLISLGKQAGFSLAEIGRILSEDSTTELPRTELHARADALEEQIAQLTSLRDTLRHVADCPAENHMDCPRFRTLIRMAIDRRGNQNPPQAANRAGDNRLKSSFLRPLASLPAGMMFPEHTGLA